MPLMDWLLMWGIGSFYLPNAEGIVPVPLTVTPAAAAHTTRQGKHVGSAGLQATAADPVGGLTQGTPPLHHHCAPPYPRTLPNTSLHLHCINRATVGR